MLARMAGTSAGCHKVYGKGAALVRRGIGGRIVQGLTVVKHRAAGGQVYHFR